MAGVADREVALGGRRLVLLGPPGCGKGTQAERLAASTGIPAISTGEMLREAVAAGSELGARVRGIMDAGELVDDDTMAEVVKARLEMPDAAAGFLLDGYPRTLLQAEHLDQILEQLAVSLDAVVAISVPEEELITRALNRQRGADDREEVVRERLRVYGEKTEPLIALYRRRGLLHEVDGHQTIDEVFASILDVLGAYA